MLVAVRAYEGMYQGLHGIEDSIVLEVKDIEEINDWGNEASTNLIYSYGLEDEYLEDDEEDSIEDSSYFSDRGWEAHKIKDGVTLSLDELNKELDMLGFSEFVNEYCDKEGLDL